MQTGRREMGSCTVREAAIGDIEAIVNIFNFEVAHGRSNYETREHTLEERRAWWKQLRDRNLPVLVAEMGDRVVGFGSLSPFSPNSGYRLTVTGALYVDPDYRRDGVGRAIARQLIIKAYELGLHSIVVAVNSQNEASLTLLESVGFERVGIFKEIGQKHGQWLDDIGLQINLN